MLLENTYLLIRAKKNTKLSLTASFCIIFTSHEIVTYFQIPYFLGHGIGTIPPRPSRLASIPALSISFASRHRVVLNLSGLGGTIVRYILPRFMVLQQFETIFQIVQLDYNYKLQFQI